jgi:cytochrome d ubiquinol oxidase subunit I
VLGLDQVAPADRPNVPIVFFAFRLMLAVGFWMLAVAVVGAVLLTRRRLAASRRYLWLLVATAPLGFFAVVAGWVVAEVGRQPWVVQGLQRTADSASPLAAASVAGSLALFFVVYNLMLFAFLYFLRRLVQHGPEAEVAAPLRERLTSWYPAPD